MDQLLRHLGERFPGLQYKLGKSFYWSPVTKEIFYGPTSKDLTQDLWALLHETSHALLNHVNYTTDIELIHLEIDAWERAKTLAKELKLEILIREDHIQNCIDTYRNWLYARCICPVCGTKSLQQPKTLRYRCFNCHTTWKVTSSRFCRAYRTIDTRMQASTLRNIMHG
jgi:hypothetical protein